MSVLDATMGIASGAARGYEGSKGNYIPGGQGAPGQGPLMQYLRHKNYQPKRPMPTMPGAPQQPPPELDNLPMPELGQMGGTPQQVPGMQGIGMPPQPPQPPQGMYPPKNPYEPTSTGAPPQFADGAVVDKPITAIIGEDGPEMVVPLTPRPDARVSMANLPQMRYQRR